VNEAVPLQASQERDAPVHAAAGEKPMGILRKLWRSTAFKLTMAYMVIFALFAVFVLGYVAWNARRLIDDQIRQTIEAEISGLAEQQRMGGLRRLIAVVDQRSRAPGASLYLVVTPFGERLAGNIDTLPPGILDSPGELEVPYARASESDRLDHRALVRVYLMPGGFRLLVGRDLEERRRLREVIRRAGGWSLLLVLLLGCAGGLVVTKRVLARVDGMNDTARRIMSGDLQGRLNVAGTGDELDRLALNLNAMLERIGELMTGLRQVSDNIAHDLKTPLTRLRNRAEEALRVSASGDELRGALEGVIDEADNLIRVFNALLMLARLEAGQVRESMGPVDANEVVESVGELYEPLAEEAGVRFDVESSPGLSFTGNRELMGQALSNLVDNALKYGGSAAAATNGMPPSPPVIGVSARGEGNTILFTVSDQGPGIAQADRARAVERFVRLDGSRSRPGFGLGLALVQGIAKLHGGTLTLSDNEPGLRAVLSIPAAAETPPEAAG
jgi:signal transduction histidine kinase